MILIESTAIRLAELFHQESPSGWWVSLHGYRSTWVKKWWWRKPRLRTDHTERVELTARRWFPTQRVGRSIKGAVAPGMRFPEVGPGIHDRLAIYTETGELLDITPVEAAVITGQYRDDREQGDEIIVREIDWAVG